MGNSAPLLAAKDVELATNGEVFADKHLRLKFRHNGRTLTMKAWNMGHHAEALRAGQRMDVLFTVVDDPYSTIRGYSPLSATLKHFRVG